MANKKKCRSFLHLQFESFCVCFRLLLPTAVKSSQHILCIQQGVKTLHVGFLFLSSCYFFFLGKKIGGDQYVLSGQKLDWTYSRDYCRTHHTDMASVRNNTENQRIQEVTGGLQVWIGLFRDPWEWSDKTYSSLRYWKADQFVNTNLEEKTCVALLESQSGRWGDRPCGETHPFLCNCEKKSSFTFFLLCFV